MSNTQVLLTRSAVKSQELAQQLTNNHITSTIQPLLELSAVDVSEQQLTSLDNADIVIFVSPDAVQFLHHIRPTLTAHSQCFAVGKSTAKSVESLFNKTCLSPALETSEGLLALAELTHVVDKHIVIVKGKGGRTKLAQALKKKEAFVHPLNVYQRDAHRDLSARLVENWQRQEVNTVVLTSNTSIDTFLTLVNNKNWLTSVTFILVSERCVSYFEQQNINVKQIINSQGADNNSILTAILHLYQTKSSNAMAQEKETSSNNVVTKQAKASDDHSKAATVAVNNRSFNGIAWLALFIAIACAGSLGFAYTLYTKQQHELALLKQENHSLQKQVDNTNAELQQVELQDLAFQQQFDETQQNLSQQVANAQRELNQQIQQELTEAKQQEPELNQEEVKSLYRMAEFKAYVQHDYLGAASMLQRLDILLASFPGTQQVRAAIYRDIQALNGIEKTNISEHYLQLEGLIGNLDSLPLKAVVRFDNPQEVPTEQLSEEISDWQANLKQSFAWLQDYFISVNKRNMPIEPVLNEEEQFLIRHRLAFYMAQAQTALMQEQAGIFDAALKQSLDIITAYYDNDSSVIANFKTQLNELRGNQFNFEPDVVFDSEQYIKELL